VLQILGKNGESVKTEANKEKMRLAEGAYSIDKEYIDQALIE